MAQAQRKREVLLVGFEAADAERLIATGRALGMEVGAVYSRDDAAVLLDARAFDLIIAAGDRLDVLLEQARQWKQKMRFAEILAAVSDPPAEVPVPLFDVLPMPLPSDRALRSILQRALRYQSAVARNFELFRRLQRTVQRVEVLQQRMAVLEAENRLLQRAVEDRPATQTEAPVVAGDQEMLTSTRLQRFFESLAGSFNKALDSMVFYSSQVLLQSDGSDAALELSRWIEREVDELRTAYEGLIQEYYTELVDD